MNSFWKSTIVLILLTLLSASGSLAEGPIPKPEEPGSIEKRFEKPVQPKSTLELDVPEMKGPKPPPDADKIVFSLTQLKIEGSSVYSDESLSPFYASYIGREVSLSDIYQIAGQLTKKYGEDGYSLSRAYVPQQKIKAGVVTIGIIEGFVDKVVVENLPHDQRGFFEDYRKKILASKPLNASVMERCMLLANDLPGLEVKSVLKPSETTKGASNLIITVQKKKFFGSLGLDNRGTKGTGPYQGSANLGLNSLFREYEQTSIGYNNAGGPSWNELNYYSFNHSEMLHSSGLKLSISASHSRSTPGTETLEQIELESENTSASAKLSYPLIRSRNQNLSMDFSFVYRDSESLILGQASSKDWLRIVRFGVNYDFTDQLKGVNQIIIEASKGLDILGSLGNDNPDASRADGKVDFTKITLNISRTQQLPNHFSLYAAGFAQGAGSALLSSEEAGFGGEQFGRAYDSSEISGDHCLAASLELRYSPTLPFDFINYIQLYGFYDIGKIYQVSPDPGTERTEDASSAGGGIRIGLAGNLSGSWELAKPLTRTVTSRGEDGYDFRSFFRLTWRFDI